MSHIKEKKSEEKPLEFKWGIEKGIGGKNRDIMFYESFTYGAVEFFVYDCAYFCERSQPDAFIGKIVRMYEGPNHGKKVKVVWFMRPSEIKNFLGDYQLRWNEIFLASGQGRGVSSYIDAESIFGKCNVVCTSNDCRNPQATEAEVRQADHFFRCHFDFGKSAISDVFPDMVDGVKVEYFFNKKKEQKPLAPPNLKSNGKEQTGLTNSSLKLKLKKAIANTERDYHSGRRVIPSVKESKTDPVSTSKQVHFPSENTSRLKTSIPDGGTQPGGSSRCQVQDKADKTEVKFPRDSFMVQPLKKRKLNPDETAIRKLDNLHCQLGQDRGTNVDNQLPQVSRRPDADRKNWFKQLPWEERLESAQERGSLVSLENLDPSYSSAEVEDLVWSAFKEKVEAKMIEKSTFSSPYYGKSLIIFQSKEAADSAISQLTKRCLMLADGRPVVARKETLRKPSKAAGFAGHLTIDRVHQRKTEEMKKAKSTSHSSQPNTYEYDLALEWRLLQEKSDVWWKLLHEQQAMQVQSLRKQLKMKSIS